MIMTERSSHQQVANHTTQNSFVYLHSLISMLKNNIVGKNLKRLYKIQRQPVIHIFKRAILSTHLKQNTHLTCL